MPIDEIVQKVSDRYARAARAGEQLCGPAGYDMARLKSFIPEEVLKTDTMLEIARRNAPGHTVRSNAVSCAPKGGCC